MKRSGPLPKKRKRPSRKNLSKMADQMFSQKVRESGPCAAQGYRSELYIHDRCSGVVQCAHVIGRRYRSVRWDPDNAVPLCAGAHLYFTSRPEEWRQFIEELYPGRYAEMWAKAQQQWDRSYPT